MRRLAVESGLQKHLRRLVGLLGVVVLGWLVAAAGSEFVERRRVAESRLLRVGLVAVLARLVAVAGVAGVVAGVDDDVAVVVVVAVAAVAVVAVVAVVAAAE